MVLAWICLIWNVVQLIVLTTGYFATGKAFGKTIYIFACIGPVIAIITALYFIYGV